MISPNFLAYRNDTIEPIFEGMDPVRPYSRLPVGNGVMLRNERAFMSTHDAGSVPVMCVSCNDSDSNTCSSDSSSGSGPAMSHSSKLSSLCP